MYSPPSAVFFSCGVVGGANGTDSTYCLPDDYAENNNILNSGRGHGGGPYVGIGCSGRERRLWGGPQDLFRVRLCTHDLDTCMRLLWGVSHAICKVLK